MVILLNYGNPASYDIKEEIALALGIERADIIENCVECRIDFNSPLKPQIANLIAKGEHIAKSPEFLLFLPPAISSVAIQICETLKPNAIVTLMRVSPEVNRWKLYDITLYRHL